MPVIGFICADNGQPVTFDSCLACAETFLNPCQYSYPLIKGMVENEGRPPSISTTQISGCHREIAIKMKNNVYTTPPYWAFRGSLTHQLIERYKRKNTEVEKQVETLIANKKVTTRPDLLIPEMGKIIEYKTTKAVPKYNHPYKNHTIQLNIQKYIIERELDIEISSLEVQYMDMAVGKRCQAKLWTDGQIEHYILPKIEQLYNVLNNGLIPDPLLQDDDNYFKCKGYCDVIDLCRKHEIEEAKQEMKKILKAEDNKEWEID